MAVRDINNDGNEDVFIGGGGSARQTYLHNGHGKLAFIVMLNDCVKIDADFEHAATSFFDADGDLAVGSGGNVSSEKGLYITRLYLNNGKGQLN